MNLSRKKIICLMLIAAFFSGCSSLDKSDKSDQDLPGNKIVSNLQTFEVSPASIDSSEPAIAAGKNGNIYAVWVEHRANKEADVMFRQYDSNAQPLSEPVRVNPHAGAATAWRGDPPTVKAGNDGAIYVGWTAKAENAKGAANILYLSVSRDNGRTFESPVKVNDDTEPASHGMHSLAVDSSGRIYFAWLDERYLNSQKAHAGVYNNYNESRDQFYFENAAFQKHHQVSSESEAEPNAELYFAVSGDGGKTFSVNKRLAENVCPCCKTSLSAALDGRLYLAWRQVLDGEYRHIALASSNDGGKSFSSTVIVSDDQWQINACPVSGAALSLNSENALKIAWFTAGKAGKQGIYTSESKDFGKTFTPRSLVSENAVGGTPALLSGEKKNITIIWTENGKLYAAKQETADSNVYETRELATGELPVAAQIGERVFIAYVENANGNRRVKMSVLK
jgi:hypothetical protein